MKKTFAVFVCIAALATASAAQTADKKTLTLKGAESVIAAAKAEAQKLQAPGGVIAVVDDGGNLMALERLDGTFSAGANISIGKAAHSFAADPGVVAWVRSLTAASVPHPDN